MATIVSMPKWGLAMKTGLVVEWLKKQGEPVQAGEPLVEIESEKATNEVDAPVTGILRWIEVDEGKSAPVGEAVAVITAPGEELSDEQVATLLHEEAEARRQKAAMLTRHPTPGTRTPSPTTSGAATRAPTSTGGRVNASPAARRLAQELGVDISSLVGTGLGGMIGREDVLRAAEQASASSEEAVEQDVQVGDAMVHYLLAGPTKAPHVVFVHGLGGSLSTWALNLPAFAGQFRICVLDLVGAGNSSKAANDYSVSAQADFLANFLDALGPDWRRVSLVGHSLGGAIILAFAERHPERVERLVLVDSAGLGSEIDGEVLDLMHEEPTPAHVREELTHFFAAPGMVQQALVDQLYQQRIQPGAHAALIATADAAFAENRQQVDLRETLAHFPGKVLLLWGESDSVIPRSHADEAKRAQHVHVEIFEHTGHCPHIEQAERFNQLATTFLREG